jgi:histidinol-phosphate aminotransferase
MSYERDTVRRAVGYAPGKQPASGDVVKLNTNENPYPPCEAVMRALREVPADALRRYPPPFADGFRSRAARVHGVATDQLIAVNGGDELIRLAITTFVDPGVPIGVLEPSYSLYPVLAELHGSPIVRVPMAADWTIPTDAARIRAGGREAGLRRQPVRSLWSSGPGTTLADLARAVRGVLVMDEAYVDFVDPRVNRTRFHSSRSSTTCCSFERSARAIASRGYASVTASATRGSSSRC